MTKPLAFKGERIGLKPILSLNRPVTFIVSSKGDGKSIHVLLWRINQFLRNGKRTLWLRTFDKDTERGPIHGFFSVIEKLLNDGELHCYGNAVPKFSMEFLKGCALGKIDGKTAFFIAPINSGGKYLGNGIPNQETYDCAVVDEFLPNPERGEREIPNLINKYKTIIASIFRERPFRQVLMGNPYTTASSWFTEYEFIDFTKVAFNAVTAPKGKPWAIYYGIPVKHLKTALNSSYARSAQLNKQDQSSLYGRFYLDDSPLIVKSDATRKTDPLVNFIVNDKTYGAWINRRAGFVAISNSPCPGRAGFVTLETETNKSAYLLSGQKSAFWYQLLKNCRMQNLIRYESPYLYRLFVPLWQKALK